MSAARALSRLWPANFYFKKVDKLVALSVLGSVLLAWGFLVGFDALHQFVARDQRRRHRRIHR